jgi:hypothetical protein
VTRLTADDVACWVLKTTRPPSQITPGWTAPATQVLERCVRRSYRLDLIAPGPPCLLWLSGRDRPGVHALGTVEGPVEDNDGGQVVPVRLTLLPEPVLRSELLGDPRMRDAEVLRMPAGSNPSWLSRAQFDAVLDRTPDVGLGPCGA